MNDMTPSPTMQVVALHHDRGTIRVLVEDYHNGVFINPLQPPAEFMQPIWHSSRDMSELLAFWNRPYVRSVEHGEGYQVWRLDGGASRRPTLLSRGDILSLDDAIAMAIERRDDHPQFGSIHTLLAKGREWVRLVEWFDFDVDQLRELGVPDEVLVKAGRA